MKTYTPGPWIVCPAYTDRSVYPVGHRINGDAVSILAEVNSQGGTAESSQANARLIAAAPALLQALQRAVDCLVIAADDTEEAGYPARAEAIQADIAAYRAAIAQATNSEAC